MGSLLSAVCVCGLQLAAPVDAAQVPPDLAEVEVRALAVDSSGVLWVGVRDRGLAELNDGRVRWEAPIELPLGVADLVMAWGELWAVGLGGTSRRRDSIWSSQEVPGNPRVVFSATPGSTPGELWFGTSEGAVHFMEGVASTFDETDGLPHAVVHQALEDHTGTVWFLCRTGLGRLSDGAVQVFFEEVNFRSGLIGPDGLPWFGTSMGLLRWTGSEFFWELEGTAVYPRLVASDGSVWMGSSSAGALRFDGVGWNQPLPDLMGHEVFDVVEGPRGEIWVGSSQGLRLVRTSGG